MAFDPNQPFEIEDNRGGFRPFDPNQPFEVLPDEPPPIAAGADEIPMPSRFQRHNGRLEGPGFRTRPEVMPDSGAPSRIGEAVVRGFEEGSQPLPPFVTPLMEGLGVFPPAGQDGTVIQRANRSVISPLAQVGEWALRGLGGAFRGAQAGIAETGAQVGQPELGRDLAAMPEAFFGMPGGLGPMPPRAPRVAAGEAPPAPRPAPGGGVLPPEQPPPRPPVPSIPAPETPTGAPLSPLDRVRQNAARRIAEQEARNAARIAERNRLEGSGQPNAGQDAVRRSAERRIAEQQARNRARFGGGGEAAPFAPDYGPNAGSVAQPRPPGTQTAPAQGARTVTTTTPLMDAVISGTDPAATAVARPPGAPVPLPDNLRPALAPQYGPQAAAPRPPVVVPPVAVARPGETATPPTAAPGQAAAPPADPGSPAPGAAAPPAPVAPPAPQIPGAPAQAAATVPGDAPPAEALPTDPALAGAIQDLADTLSDPRPLAEIQKEREAQAAADAVKPEVGPIAPEIGGLSANPPAIPPPSPAAPPPLTPQSIADAAEKAADPTPGQAKAGNYKHGDPINIGGVTVLIETPLGRTRSGVGEDGKPWSVEMPADYGKIRGTKGADGEPMDVYLGPHAHEAPQHTVYVIDQIDPRTGRFDEHKIMVGYPTEEGALHAYSRAFNDGTGPDRIGAVTPLAWGAFRAFIRVGGSSHPLKYETPEARAEREAEAAEIERADVEADVRAYVAHVGIPGFTDAMVREAADLAMGGAVPGLTYITRDRMAVPEAVAEVVSRHASETLDKIEQQVADKDIPLPFTLEPTENGLLPVATPPRSEGAPSGQPDARPEPEPPAERPPVGGTGGGADEGVQQTQGGDDAADAGQRGGRRAGDGGDGLRPPAAGVADPLSMSARDYNRAIYEAAVARLRAGGQFRIVTAMRITPYTKPQHADAIRYHGGMVEIREGKRWVGVIGGTLDALARQLGLPTAGERWTAQNPDAAEPDPEDATTTPPAVPVVSQEPPPGDTQAPLSVADDTQNVAPTPQTDAASAPPVAEEDRNGRVQGVAAGGGEVPPQAGLEPGGQPAGSEAAGAMGDGASADDGAPAQDRPARPKVPRVRAGRPPVRDEASPAGPGDASDGRGGTGDAGVADVGAGGGGTAPAASRPNFRIDDPDGLIGGTPKVRFARNKAAILALQAVEEENRPPTQDELEALAAYTGWGSFGQELFQGTWDRPMPKDGWQAEDKWLREHLGEAEWRSAQRSIINAHYTDPPTVQAMWRMVERMGFKGGRILEPSMGIGNFFGMMPAAIADRSDLTGIELDSLTGRMAKLLYPQANIQIKGYQDSQTPDGFYDLVIGNWPFAADGPADRRYDKINPSLHDYFFLKAMDQVREGGLVVGVTSAGTMDKQGRSARMKLAEQGDIVSAFRLPSGAFEKYAGTKVVTDIIILQKRPAGAPPSEATTRWIETAERAVDGGVIRVNDYYQDNPENVLGTLGFGSGTTYGRAGMIVHRPDDLMARLTQLHEKVPEGIYKAPERKKKEPRFVINNTTQRQNAVVVGEDGALYQVQGERLAALSDLAKGLAVKDKKKADDRTDQVRKLVGIREAYAKLIDAERAGAADTEDLRKALNKAYQAFRKAHGAVRASDGIKIMDAVEDPFTPALEALERPDGSPSLILTEAVTRANRIGENPSIAEAYVMARNEAMVLDLDRVAELAKKPRAQVEKELLEKKAIYRTPGGGFEAADAYLSGNVRLKLRQAQDAVQRGEPMQDTVKALEGVQPKDVPYFQIEAKLGATWVGEDTYRAFLKDMLGLTDDEAGTVHVRFKRGRWQVVFTNERLMGRPEATTTRGSQHYRFDKLVAAAMGNIAPVIRYRDPVTRSMVEDRAATEEVNDRIAKLREEFSTWAWRDPERRVRLERGYNEVMNAIGKPQYDGSFLDMSGMALRRGDDPFSLRQHQQNAIWRGVSQGRGLFAHEVGTGKTYTMAGVAVEGRRFGVHKKPIVFAHNANSAAVAREMQEMYPGGKFLYVNNLAPGEIKRTLYRIANEDWDAVIMPHSLIDKIGLKRETLMDLAQEEIDALEEEAYAAAEADGVRLTADMFDDEKAIENLRSVTAKNLVKQRQAIIKKIDQMANRASEADAISFEDLGVDAVIVDEAHEFKKPSISTRMRVKGLNTGTSDRSIALQFLTGYVRKRRAGKGTYLFTGTPITNSLVEIFNMMRYVMQDRMDRDGIGDWDSWFGSFADAIADVELTATGEYETVTRLSAFVNTDELVKVASEFVDVVQASDMPEFAPRATKSGKTLLSGDLTADEREELTNGRTEKPEGRPYKKVVTDVGEMSYAQKQIFEHLKGLAKQFRDASKLARYRMMKTGHPASPVIVETNAANASLDARLYDPVAGDDAGSKVNRAVANIMRHYNEHPQATQAVFVDRGYAKPKSWDGTAAEDLPPVLVQDLVQKLVAAGVPKNEIAIVAGGTSAERKKQIADAMNKAQIRVVIGQSQTLGVGVNMQVNLRAMHHLDAPWRPGDLEQRNGRGERQGNKWNTVLEYRYITEGIDGRRWQVLSAKDRFIKQFIRAFNDDSGKRIGALEGDAAEISDDEGGILDTLAKAAGDARVQQRSKLKADVERLQRRERQHTLGIADAGERIRQLQQGLVRKREMKSRWTPALATWEAGRARAKKAADAAKQTLVWNEAVIDGKQLRTNDEIGKAMDAALRTVKPGQKRSIGTINGLHLIVDWAERPRNDFPFVSVSPEADRTGWEMTAFSPQAVSGAISQIRNRLTRVDDEIPQDEAAIPRLEAAMKEEFPQQAKLDKARQQLADLEADLQANPIAPPAWLRNGAMLDAAVWVDGHERTVRGHRVSDTYYVLTDEGPVPYLEVKDQNGLPVFEEHDPPRVEQGASAQTPNSTPQAAAGWDALDAGVDAAPSPEAIEAVADAVRAVTGGRATVRFVREAIGMGEVRPGAQGTAGAVALGPLIVVAMGQRAAWNLHHESVHVLRNLGVIDPAEWRVLEAAAARGGWLKEFSILNRYAFLAVEKQVEEAIAEKFGQWSMAGAEQPKGRVARSWNRVQNFVGRLGNALMGRGFLTASDVFNRIKAGEMAARPTGSRTATRGPQTADEALAALAFFDAFKDTKPDLASVLAEARFAMAPANPPPGGAVTFAVEQPGRLDEQIYRFQDRHIDAKRTLEAIKKAGGTITDDTDVRLREELFHNRVAKAIKDFRNEEVRPLLERMEQLGVKLSELEEYLWARHAKERNAHIAKIDPNRPDGGSGLTDAEADAIMARYQNGQGGVTAQGANLAAVASWVDAIASGTRRTWLAYELEDADTIRRMTDTYQHYVPLQRDEMGNVALPDGQGVGQGFSTRGSSTRRALGSDRPVVDILGNLFQQRERAISRGEKNRVANALIDLARDNQNPDFWRVNRPPMIRYFNQTTGMVASMVDPNFKSLPNVVVARSLDDRGRVRERAVVFNERDKRAARMAIAIKNLDMDEMHHVLGRLAIATRLIARLNTQYNPIFGIVNLIRDAQEAVVNLASTEIPTKQRQVAAGLLPAFAAILRSLRRDRGASTQATDRWTRAWAEFQAVGGPTGYRDLFTTGAERAQEIEKELARLGESGATRRAKAPLRWMRDALSDFNEALENATRLSAFVAAKDAGMTTDRAASLAKNLTVNFNRKGAWTNEFGAFFAFFNANVQGTARMVETLVSKAGKPIIAAGLAVGMAQQAVLTAAGFEENEIPAFILENNFVIPTGGKTYAKVPMPLGFKVLPNVGRVSMDLVLTGGEDAGKKMKDLVGTVAGSFNPLGATGISAQMFAPTALDPIVAVLENRDWTGRELAIPNRSGLHPTPGYTRSRDSDTVASKWAAQQINRIGGTDWTPGWVSPTPTQIDYLIGQYAGGVGREVMNALRTGDALRQGQAPDVARIPLVGRFVGSGSAASATRSVFYENIKKLNEHADIVKGMAGDGQDAAAYVRQHPEATLALKRGPRVSAPHDAVQRQISKLRQQQRAAKASGADKETLQRIEQAITDVMASFNARVKAAKAPAR